MAYYLKPIKGLLCLKAYYGILQLCLKAYYGFKGLQLLFKANISPVRFVLHLQKWLCVGKRETSFPLNKLWLIYLPPSLWPLTISE